MQKEIWKDVKGYEGYYQVSNLGNIRGLDRKIKHSTGSLMLKKGKKLIPRVDTTGYHYVNLSKECKVKSKKIHQLVAMSFKNHKPNGYKIVVNHKDHNKLNNTPDNLQLVTARKNTSHRFKKGTSKYPGIYWNKKECKWHAQIWHINKSIHLGHFSIEYDAHIAYENKLKEISKYEN